MGTNLLPTALLIIVLGLFTAVAAKVYESYLSMEQEETTDVRVINLQKALIDYYTLNGRYPCPASFTAAPDTPAFGVEVADCTVASAGIMVAPGFGKNPVASGHIPVRTLGLSDEDAFDGWRKRVAYSISTGFTPQNLNNLETLAEIKMTDQNGVNVTSAEGNVIFAVTAFRDVDAGAYSIDGQLIAPCTTGNAAEEICNFDHIFARSNVRSDAGIGANNALLAYHTGKLCNQAANVPPRVGFLLDSSLSMTQSAACPPGKAGPCNRMDMALWALHRTMFARLQQTQSVSNAFTGYTNFTPQTDVTVIENLIGSSFEVSNDGNGGGTTNIDDIYNACPSGGTPLGSHLQAVANLVEPGEDDSPHVITIISDGVNSHGLDPLTVATQLANSSSNIKINIIDVGNSPALANIAALTGGDYLQTNNPDDLLAALQASVGICNAPLTYPDISGKEQCGGAGATINP